MKKLIPILIFLFSVVSSFGATVHLAPGSYVNPCASGDVLIVTAGNYGYVTFVGVQNVTIYNDGTGTSKFSNGFAFIDCQHFNINYKGTFIGKNTGTTAINISGKSGDFYMKNATMDSVYSWAWVKQDPSCDTSLNHWVIYNIWIDSFYCTHAAFDGNYFGNTSPGGANAAPCNISYVPAQLDSFKLTNSFYDGSARQCFQLSEASNPFGHSNLIANCFFGHAGRAKDPCLCQGVCGYLGGRTGKTLVTNCTFTNGWVGTMVLSGSGVQTVTNCSFDSSGFLDGQQNTSGAYPFIYAKNLNPYPSPQPTFVLQNNTVTSHFTFSAQVGVDQLGSPNPQWTTNNIACNTGTLHIAAGITYTTSCGVIPPMYTLTYIAISGGTISGTNPQTVNSGGNGASVTAVPNTGYHFVSWNDGNTNATRNETNVLANATYSASFAINTYTLTYVASSNGSITGATPQNVNYNGSGTSVTATPNSGYHFVSWEDGNTNATRTDANVTSNQTHTASFAINSFVITSSVNGSGGTITPLGATGVASGGSITYSISANAGYSISTILVDGSSVSVSPSYTFSNVTANHTIVVSFSTNTFTVTFTAGANGTLSGNLNQTVSYNASTTAVTATPNTGFYFAGWTILNNNVNPLIVNNVIANASYTANFLPLPQPAIIVAFSGTFNDGSGWQTTTRGSKKKPIRTANITWQDSLGNTWIQPLQISSKPVQ